MDKSVEIKQQMALRQTLALIVLGGSMMVLFGALVAVTRLV
jgi:hypothetical protein